MTAIFYQHDGWLHISTKELQLPERVLFYSSNPSLAVRKVNYRAAVPAPIELCPTEMDALDRLIANLNEQIGVLQSRFESLSFLEGDEALSAGYDTSRTIRMCRDLLLGLERRRNLL
jgi:hypothetical protein